jgi:hypothetical protein
MGCEISAVEGAKAAQSTICPKCKTDVMVTGWTEYAAVTRSYMRFKGQGAVMIASSRRAAARATCLCCQQELKLTPVELMRMA